MKKSTLFLPLAILTIVLLAGCGQNAPSTNTDTVKIASTGTQQNLSKDLCVRLSPEDVSAILGHAVTGTNDNLPTSLNTSGCNYQSTDPAKNSVTIIAMYDTEAAPAKAGYESAVEYQKQSIDPSMAKVEEIAGIGDKASITTTPVMANLLTLKGNTWITISMAGSDATTRDEMLKKLAQKALTVL